MSDAKLSVSRDTLHDLVVCARHIVGQLGADQLQAVSRAIAEADGELARLATPPPAPIAPSLKKKRK